MNAEHIEPKEQSSEQLPLHREVTLEMLHALLSCGELELQGMMPWSSNYTFLALVRDGDLATYVVYKPRRGERPLWDFPNGTLCKREVAAYLVSEALGWGIVPPTVLRDGPYGVGSVQLFIDADHEQHYFTLRDHHVDDFKRVAVFDVVINNADRKGGHCLLDDSGRIWGVDHGIAFHNEDKLRTVIWDWAGQAVPEELVADVQRFLPQLEKNEQFLQALSQLLSKQEMAALQRRTERLLARPVFPLPISGRSVPWPSI